MERPAFTYGHIWTFQCQIWQQLFHQYLFLLNCWPACISFARPDSLQLGIRGGKSLSETLTLEGLPPQVLKCKMFSKPKRNPTHAICQLVIMALIPFLNLLTIFCVSKFPHGKLEIVWSRSALLKLFWDRSWISQIIPKESLSKEENDPRYFVFCGPP